MKRTILAFIALVYCNSIVSGQDITTAPNLKKEKGFYVRGGLGYAISYAGQTFDPLEGIYSGTTTNPSSSTAYIYNVNKVSFSSGLRGYLGLGYMFNKNAGIELSTDIGIVNRKYIYTGTNYSASAASSGATDNADITQNAHLPFILSPSLVLQTSNQVWNLYTRLGIALPISHSIDIDEEHTYITGATSSLYVYKESLQTSFSLGFNGAVGVSYGVSKDLKFWAEMSVLSLVLYADELDLTSASVNGIDNYANQTRTVIPFRTNSNNLDAFMTYAIPFSNIAFNMGLSWNLHKKGATKHVTPRKYNRR